MAACHSSDQNTSPAITEGYAEMDDGVRLYYRVVGSGEQVVVIPVGLFLEDVLAPLAQQRRLVFYDPRHRGRSDAGDLAAVSLQRQILDLEQLRIALGLEQMALIGWSGLGMEMAAYTLQYPQRVTRLVQVGAVPPAASIMAAAGDGRNQQLDRQAINALDARADNGELDGETYCRLRNELTLPASFVDDTLIIRVADSCHYENEWPENLWPYFGALLGSFGDYDWRPELVNLPVPRLVIHGREDGIPLAGAYAWVAGFPEARLLILSPAGHFPFIEQPKPFFAAVDEFLKGRWPADAEIIEAE